MNQGVWLQAHAMRLNSRDVGETFAYVRRHHPFKGNLSKDPTVADKKCSIEVLAEKAHIVTMVCCQLIGELEAATVIREDELKELTATAIGNVSFVALHHDNPRIRTHFTALLDRWRRS